MEDDTATAAAAASSSPHLPLAAPRRTRSKAARNSKRTRDDDEATAEGTDAAAAPISTPHDEERKQSMHDDDDEAPIAAAAALPAVSSSSASASAASIPSSSSRSRRPPSKKQRLTAAAAAAVPLVITSAAASLPGPLFSGLVLDCLSSVFAFLNTRAFLRAIRVSRHWREARVKRSAWPALSVDTLTRALQEDDYDNPARRRLQLDIGRHPYTPTLKRLQANPASLSMWRYATAAHVTHKRTTGAPNDKDRVTAHAALQSIAAHFPSISALTLHDAAAEPEAVQEFYEASSGKEHAASSATSSSSASSSAAAAAASSSSSAAASSAVAVRRAPLQAVLLARCSDPFFTLLPVLSSSLRVLVLDRVLPDGPLLQLVNMSYLHMEVPSQQWTEAPPLNPPVGRALRVLSTLHALRSLSLNVAREAGTRVSLMGLPMLTLAHEPVTVAEWGLESTPAEKAETFIAETNASFASTFADWSKPSALEALSITGKLSAQADRVVLSTLLAGFARLPSLRRLNWLQVNSLYDPFNFVMMMLQFGAAAPLDVGTPLLPAAGAEQPAHLSERLAALEELKLRFFDAGMETGAAVDLSSRLKHLEVCTNLRVVHLSVRLSAYSLGAAPIPASVLQRLFAAWSPHIEEIRFSELMDVEWTEPAPQPQPQQMRQTGRKSSGAAPAKSKGKKKGGAAAAAASSSAAAAAPAAAAAASSLSSSSAAAAASASSPAAAAAVALTIDPSWSSLASCHHLRVLELPLSVLLPPGFILALSSLPHFRALELSWRSQEQPCQPAQSILCAMAQSRRWRTLRLLSMIDVDPDFLQAEHECGLDAQLHRLSSSRPAWALSRAGVEALAAVRVFGHAGAGYTLVSGFRIDVLPQTGHLHWMVMSEEEVDNEA